MKQNQEEKQRLKDEEKSREIHHKEVIKAERDSHKQLKVAPSDDILILKNINKIYPNHAQAVYDFNLSVKKNEFIVLVGPSGCGKSTTLKMIAGLEEITSGDLFIDGKYANYTLSKNRDLAMVFQSYALYPTMSVYKNIAFPLTISGEKSSVIKEKVYSIAKTLELDEDLLSRRPSALSGGQRQRVALARAMVKGSKLLLMDEPLSNLDAKLRTTVRSEIVDLHKRINATTMYVTHDQVEAMTMSDRLVVMNKGYVEQIGAPQEIYDHPKTLFVATFIGSPSMNIIKSKTSKDSLILENGFNIKLNKEQHDKIKKYYQDILIEIQHDIAAIEKKKETRINDLKKVGYLSDVEKLNKEITKQLAKVEKMKKNLSKSHLSEEEYQLKEKEIFDLSEKYHADYQTKLEALNQKEYPLLDEAKLKHLLEEDQYIRAYDYDVSKQIDILHRYEEVVNKEEKDLLLGARVEDILIDIDKKDRNHLSEPMKIHVHLAELLGHEYYLSFNVNETLCNLKASAFEEILPNQDFNCYFDLDKIHLFDPLSHRAIF